MLRLYDTVPSVDNRLLFVCGSGYQAWLFNLFSNYHIHTLQYSFLICISIKVKMYSLKCMRYEATILE